MQQYQNICNKKYELRLNSNNIITEKNGIIICLQFNFITNEITSRFDEWNFFFVDLLFNKTHSIRYRLNPIDCITTLSMSPTSSIVCRCAVLIVVKCN